MHGFVLEVSILSLAVSILSSFPPDRVEPCATCTYIHIVNDLVDNFHDRVPAPQNKKYPRQSRLK